MLDLDHFKNVNDNHGHMAGDNVLKQFSQAVAGTIRTCDIVCRLGGEEFAIVCPESDAVKAKRCVERIRDRVEAEDWIVEDHKKIQITFSAGIAELGKETQYDDLMKNADKALYQAKKKGRDCCVIFSEMLRKVS